MLNTIALLLQHFLLLTCFKRKPQDLPASGQLLAIVVTVYVAIGCIHNGLHDTVSRSVFIGVLDILIMFLYVHLCLRLFNHDNRWMQTITSLAGSGMILTLFAIPVSLGLIRTQEQGIYPVFAFLLLFLFIWSISVHAHIFRHAFSLSFGAGVVFALFYNLLSFMIISSLVQVPASR